MSISVGDKLPDANLVELGAEGPAAVSVADVTAGRKIGLNVVVFPATGEEKSPDAITYFAGGPGDGSTSSGAWIAQRLATVRENRDLMLVDFRGTGRSNRKRTLSAGGFSKTSTRSPVGARP